MAERPESPPMLDASQLDQALQYVAAYNEIPERDFFTMPREKRKNRSEPSKASKNPLPLGFKFFNDIVTKDPLTLILTLRSRGIKFSELFKKSHLKRDLLLLILKVLAKGCDCPQKENLAAFLKGIPEDEFVLEVQRHLVTLNWYAVKDEDIMFIENVVKFLLAFIKLLPSNAINFYSILKPHLQSTIETLKTKGIALPSSIAENLDCLSILSDDYYKVMTDPETEIKLTYQEKLHAQPPPDDFREIPILPSWNELKFNELPFLRYNITTGKYNDVNHYLDVQYRLLREDFVRPLREGINEYKTLSLHAKNRSILKDIRIYHNVCILHGINTEGGIVNVIKFDVSRLQRIRWEQSKRLLYGSLLCLTKDNFENLFYATVVNRDPEFLRQGYLEVQFVDLSVDFLFHARQYSYIMVETSAYFEAYRYVLKGLQSITEENFPFKEYIVNVKREIEKPLYLNQESLFDIGPLLHPLPPPILEIAPRLIPIMDLHRWPSQKECGLDEAQYTALQAALTKEFAIIQGPPGTGKTYIGLRIVQLLLKNRHLWTTTSESPIFIVCYTNHALDQFLEGLLHFTDKVVRIGGRCKSESLENFQINKLRQNRRLRRDTPRHIHENVYQIRNNLNFIEEEIEKIESLLRSSNHKLIPLNHLLKYMKSDHYQSLSSSKGLLNWLLADASQVWDEDVNDDDGRNEFVATKPLDLPASQEETEEEEEEIDVDAINAMREIDCDDFKHDYGIMKKKIKEKKNKNLKEEEPESTDGFQLVKRQKKDRNYIQREISKNDYMSENEERFVSDVWHLNIHNRWRLYLLWLARFSWDFLKYLKKLQEDYLRCIKELKEIRLAEDISIAQAAHVVGMTTSGAAKFRHIVEHLASKIVIVEEAAEVLEAHILTSLTKNTQHLILIGDHQQLRPSANVYELARKYNLEVSLFERMVNNNLECNRLVTQHRMRPCISQILVPHIYKELKNAPSVEGYEPIKGVEKNMFFINHNISEAQVSETQSHSNVHEAKFLVELCKYLRLQGYPSDKITILTTYSSQMFQIRKMTRTDLLKNIRVTVVDNYQGEENDIILISFVRSNEEGSIGFLKTSNRACVALSRARKGLYCVGNFELLAEKSKLWKNITIYLKENNYIGESLRLRCENHPKNFTLVKKAEDFSSVSEGGCNLFCNYRLNCGHSCTRECHPYDPDHLEFKCTKSCERLICEKGHRCTKRCCDKCGLCKVKVPKTMPLCNHVVQLECSLDPLEATCPAKCEKILSCGHQCQFLCRDICPPCNQKVDVVASCGHTITIKCFEKQNIAQLSEKCTYPCEKTLTCGHLCKGTCSTCYQGRLHIFCKEKCGRILLCNHQCKNPCAENCPPCDKKCENFCFHSKCPMQCGVPCTPCIEYCDYKCPHYSCSKLCYEKCDRPPCNEPCPKKLKCQHPCMGYCGEPCPILCGICDKDKLSEIFFGTEDEDDARFVMLQDCKHVFESSGLDHWMTSETGNEIQMKSCPKCKTIIRKNYRFGNIIKENLEKINKVKQKIFGEGKELKDMKQNMGREIVMLSLNLSRISLDNLAVLRNITEDLLRQKQSILTQIYSKGQLIKIINIIRFINLIIKFKKNNGFLFEIDEPQFKNVAKFVSNSLVILTSALSKIHFGKMEYQFEDLDAELTRLNYTGKICGWMKEYRSHSTAVAYFEKISNLLLTPTGFSPSIREKINTLFEEAKKKVGTLGITLEEKNAILKAMNLSKGHWFTCPNGHIYCITECGGAMVEGRCNECNATIGGGNHTLRRDNRVATEMDGASYPAYSDLANIHNFDPHEFM